jgi:plasmid maintenance system antidote protein VapI
MRKKAKCDFEEQFRQAILHSGYSRYRLSHLTGVSQAALSNFVKKKRSLTLATAARLADVLGLSVHKGRGK